MFHLDQNFICVDNRNKASLSVIRHTLRKLFRHLDRNYFSPATGAASAFEARRSCRWIQQRADELIAFEGLQSFDAVERARDEWMKGK
jgi:hypothetical protein